MIHKNLDNAKDSSRKKYIRKLENRLEYLEHLKDVIESEQIDIFQSKSKKQ